MTSPLPSELALSTAINRHPPGGSCSRARLSSIRRKSLPPLKHENITVIMRSVPHQSSHRSDGPMATHESRVVIGNDLAEKFECAVNRAQANRGDRFEWRQANV